MREIDITSIPGFKLGHADNQQAATGCTAVLCPEGAVAGVDVRGGAPGTRETDLLRPENSIEHIHAVLLAGGSAFGLDAAGGIASFLEERKIGIDTGFARVPIVPGAILFDLGVGQSDIRPDKEMGYQAAQHAWDGTPFAEGNTGCGTGASVGKCLGSTFAMKSGIGLYAVQYGEIKIGAMIAVNAFGDIINPATNKFAAGAYNRKEKVFIDSAQQMLHLGEHGKKNKETGNTIIGTIVTNASFTKSAANKLASIAHDGLARTTKPAHTFFDGDTIFVMGSNRVEAEINALGILSAHVVEKAVLRAVLQAKEAYGLPSAQSIHQ